MAVSSDPTRRKDVLWVVRMTPEQNAVIRNKAAVAGHAPTEFVTAAAGARAEVTLADRRLFRLDDAAWSGLAETLDRPARRLPESSTAVQITDRAVRGYYCQGQDVTASPQQERRCMPGIARSSGHAGRLENNFPHHSTGPALTTADSVRLTHEPSASLAGHPISPDWFALRDAVRQWRPDLIVAVARKMPRINEAIGLRLSDIAVTVSDQALCFSAPYVSGARVAVIDDIVNVGSTMDQATFTAQRLGAVEVSRFALHARDKAVVANSGAPLVLVSRDPYSVEHCALVSRQAPLLISMLNKSYDLDFPVLETELAIPFSGAEELHAFLADKYGKDVYDLSTAVGRANGLHRFTIDRFATIGGFGKARVYLDAKTRRINVVPMRIGAPLPTEASVATQPTDLAGRARTEWTDVIAQRLNDAAGEERNGETAARIHLFVDSLAFGVGLLSELRGVIEPAGDNLLSTADAAMAFGPAARDLFVPAQVAPYLSMPTQAPAKALAQPVSRAGGRTAGQAAAAAAAAQNCSPAFTRIFCGSFEDELRAANLIDPLVVTVALFDQLARWIGADDPEAYRLPWPLTSAQVSKTPYKRLRIGFTATDIAEIVKRICPGSRSDEGWQRTVSKILDILIDAGTIVPTIANYDGQFYRVYRKGEPGKRDEASDRFLLALGEYNKPMYATRMSKVGAIVSFVMPAGGALSVAPEVRGNVLNIDGDLVDDDAEITQFLRRTGQIRRHPPSGPGSEE